MNSRLTDLVWDTPLPATQKLLLLFLAGIVLPDNTCCPSIDAIAERLCCSRMTVFNALNKLEKVGLLARSRRKAAPNIYTLKFPEGST